MFETREDATQKLSGCVVIFEDRPVHINEAVGKGKTLTLRFTDLRTNKEGEGLISNKAWDFQNLGARLGYTNVDLGTGSYKEALFLTRSAVRRSNSTQGLSGHNLKIPPLKGSSRLGLNRHSIGWGSLYNQKYFLDTLEMKYPSLEDISKHFAKDPWLSSKSFSREFAVRRPDVGPFFLEYKGKDVGHTDDLSKWKLAEQYKYLSESLSHMDMKVSNA